jgi:alkylated DNA repair dioxygenase AlkB
VHYSPTFLPQVEAQALFEALLETEPWHQSRRKMYDRELDVPRLQTWYGTNADPLVKPDGTPARTWPPLLAAVRERIEEVAGVRFDGVLLNLYRDGRDSVAWHSDYERRQDARAIIASLSLGATRRFMFRPKPGFPGQRMAFDLPAGSLLLMGQGTQQFWEHHVPKTSRLVGPRINLTFRQVS